MSRFVPSVLLAASLLLSGRAFATPSANIADYVLLAGQELNAKSLVVESGDVAVNAGSLRSHSGLQAGSSRVSADQVDIDPMSTCAELNANAVVESGGGCTAGAGFSAPIFPDLGAACGYPSSPTACDPSRPVTVGHKQSQTLPPGVYGDLFVAGASPGHGTLVLEGGDYVFCNVDLGTRARLFARARASIQIATRMELGLGSFTGPASGSSLGAGDLSIFFAGADARFQRRAGLVGRICAPHGRLWLMHGASLEGQGVAERIRAGRVSVRQGKGGATTTTTPTPTTTSTSSTTSSTAGTTTSTSTTSTTSAPVPSTTSTSIASTSTSSTSTTSTTSTTGPGPSTTSTSTTSTSSTTSPGPTSTSSTSTASSTTSSSTSTTSTTSTTIGSSVCGNGMTEAPETCDDGNTVNTDACPSDCIVDPCEQTQTAAVTLSVTLVSDGADSFGVGTVFVDYPEGLVFLPGSADSAEVQGAVTNRPTTGSPTCLVNDRDHGLQFGCLSTAGFSEGLIFRAAFRDCQSPTTPSLQDFSCTVLEASDTIGFPLTATCSLQFQ